MNWFINTKTPKKESFTGYVLLTKNDKIERVIVNCFNTEINTDNLNNYFVENNRTIVINAKQFSDKVENKDIKIDSIKGICIYDESLNYAR